MSIIELGTTALKNYCLFKIMWIWRIIYFKNIGLTKELYKLICRCPKTPQLLFFSIFKSVRKPQFFAFDCYLFTFIFIVIMMYYRINYTIQPKVLWKYRYYIFWKFLQDYRVGNLFYSTLMYFLWNSWIILLVWNKIKINYALRTRKRSCFIRKIRFLI